MSTWDDGVDGRRRRGGDGGMSPSRPVHAVAFPIIGVLDARRYVPSLAWTVTVGETVVSTGDDGVDSRRRRGGDGGIYTVSPGPCGCLPDPVPVPATYLLLLYTLLDR